MLLIVFVVEHLPGSEKLPWGSDLLHDATRKGIITVTVCLVLAKFIQPFCGGDALGSGVPPGPQRKKKTEGSKNEFLEWATSEMQGWRPAMEDATCAIGSLPEPLADKALFAVFDGHGGAQVSRIVATEFAKVLIGCAANMLSKEEGDDHEAEVEDANVNGEVVTDGKGDQNGQREGINGHMTMTMAGKSLHSAMISMDALLRSGGSGAVPLKSGPAQRLNALRKPEAKYKIGERVKVRDSDQQPWRPGVVSSLKPLKVHVAGHSDTLEWDQVSPIGNDVSEKRNAFDYVGSAAVVALIEHGEGFGASSPSRPRRLAVANCGDSRALICRAGKVVELSEDHKPELPGEAERIRKAGGYVAAVGPCHRVDGWGLNLSRALGDFHYKARLDLSVEEQKVIAVPEIRILTLTDEDEFLVLGCDGCFELNTSQQVVDIVREGLQSGLSVKKAAEFLLDRSCSPNIVKTRSAVLWAAKTNG